MSKKKTTQEHTFFPHENDLINDDYGYAPNLVLAMYREFLTELKAMCVEDDGRFLFGEVDGQYYWHEYSDDIETEIQTLNTLIYE